MQQRQEQEEEQFRKEASFQPNINNIEDNYELQHIADTTMD